MKIFYCDTFVLPLPDGHRFPMEKYRLLRERVVSDPGAGWGELEVPSAADDESLGRVHTPAYLDAVRTGSLDARAVRAIGFPWSEELVERSLRSVGGTIAAAIAALDEGAAANLAGGTHHAFSDRGEGFCVFNDVAVAARSLLEVERVRRVGVLDLDVHQGNGTAAIFAGDPRVRTVSVHGANNFPFRKEASDLDLPLADGSEDLAFLRAVEEALEFLATPARPDLLFYLAGADAFVGDRLGRLSVSREGMARRDRLVLDHCRQHGLPVTVVMAGGYARDVVDTVDIHFHSVRCAAGAHRFLVPTGGA